MQWPHGSAAHLAEVADERVDLAAVVRDERDDARDPLDLGLLPPLEPVDEAREQLVPRSRLREHREALAHVARAQLDEPLLLEMTERRDDAAPLLPQRGRRFLGIEIRPEPPRLAARHDPPEEVGPRGVECGIDVVERSRQRAEAVAGVERRALPQEAVELEIGEDRLQHERPDVEPARELVVGDGELRPDVVGEDVVEQARDRLARGRVAEREVLERRDVVLRRRRARTPPARRRGRPGRSPGSTTRGPWAG